MTLTDLITYSRFLVGETVAGRFSDGDLTTVINVAQNQLQLDLAWPEMLMTATTVVGTQEYQLPPILRIIEAYIGLSGQFGQLLVPTTLARLEGIPLNFYDQTSTNFQPQWTQVTQMPYPVGNSDSGLTGAGYGPYATGQRPVRYLRGGNIGLVPAPTTGQILTVRVVPFPPDLVQQSDISMFPTICKRAVGCHAAMQLIESDNPESPSVVMPWLQKYQFEAGRLATWRDTLDFNLDTTPQFQTYRSWFSPPIPHTEDIS